MATKYDKSKIMTRAWYLYRHSFVTFSEALSESWRLFKEEIAAHDKLSESMASYQAKHSSYNAKLSRTYATCQYGRNDWSIDHQDDAYAVIRRSLKNRRLNNNK